MEKDNSTQSIFKKAKREDKYAQISNDLINNRNLSYKAMGILVYILSKPDDWSVYISDLMRKDDNEITVEGEKSVRSGINELIENKYMQRYRVYDADTKKVNHWETLVSEEPFADNELISCVREKYLKDVDGKFINQIIKFGTFERLAPIVVEREIELLSQNGKVDKKIKKKLLSQNVKVAKVKVANEGQQILIPTNTDSNQNLNSSSSTYQNLIDLFANSICELKKTTQPKFIEYCNSQDTDLIKAILEYSDETNIKSFAGFKTIIENAIAKEIDTADKFNNSVESYRAEKKEKQDKREKANNRTTYNKNTQEPSKLKFNNFEGREYDYDSLEKKLLGWD